MGEMMANTGYMTRACWSTKENSYEEREDLLTWGVAVGMHGSEQNAMEALERHELIKVANPSKIGPKHMYAIPKIS
eukprot:961158-Alexandrium_andersonii.AAC.1